MPDVKHRPTMSAPPSYSMPTSPTKRKRIWEQVASGQRRIVAILILGTSIFLALQSAFGQLSRPRFQHLDTFPRKIWQSWKTDPLRFDERDLKRARSWTGLNPSHRYEVLTDQNALPWVELHFGPSGFNRPDIVTTYKALESNLKIIQADLLRYLILYAEGGIWADIDVQAIKPIDSFIPKGFREQDIQMVIGIETDEPDFKDHPILGSKAQSFCQWTFACKPRLPVMLKLIDNIQIWLARLAQEQGKEISQLHLGFDEVLSGTGPSAFTNAILKQMSKDTRRAVTWEDFHDMTDSILVGGVLVLPAEAFAAGTGHSKSGNHGSRRALVKHHFHASSWTTRHPRQKHPIYGEVERCNWDMECVRLWDANTAFYSSLPEKDQQRMIGIKRLQETESEEGVKSSDKQAPVDGGQIPMAVVQDAGPPDLAAIAKFLGQKVDEPADVEAASPQPEEGQASEQEVVEDPKKETPLDLAAIARYLGQKVEEPVKNEGPPEKGVSGESVPNEEAEATLDLAAIARFLGQKVDEAPVAAEAKAVEPESPIDLAAIARAFGQKVDEAPAKPEPVMGPATKNTVTIEEDKAAPAKEKPVKDSIPAIEVPEVQSQEAETEESLDEVEDDDEFEAEFWDDEDLEDDGNDVDTDEPATGGSGDAKNTPNQRSMFSRLWPS